MDRARRTFKKPGRIFVAISKPMLRTSQKETLMRVTDALALKEAKTREAKTRETKTREAI
jgi:hypothetical protein